MATTTIDLQCIYSMHALSFCYCSIIVLEVSFSQPSRSVFEGESVMVCAAFNGTLLDRDVMIFFSIEPINATGNSARLVFSMTYVMWICY